MKAPFSIIKRSYTRVGIGVVVLIVALFLFFSNARFSEEFTWWVKITIAGTLDETAVKSDIVTFFKDKGYPGSEIAIQLEQGTTKLSLRTQVETDEKVAILSKDIQSLLIDKGYIQSTNEVIEQSVTWPSVWAYMQKSAKNALVVGIILMAIYMMFSFAGIRKEISPSILAAVVVGTMIFDVAVPAWAYGVWMMLDKTMAVNTVFIIAVLTNMWYSINDTIIIFDRIRENIKNKAGQKWILFGKIFEDSLWQTMRRSLGTVFAVFVVIVAMFILWTWAIREFAFTIWMWIIFGSYSSIFISAPLTYILLGKYRKERKEMLAQK